jgi:hypothetical protein
VQLFSEWEVMFLCTIVNSTHIIQGRERRIYWCSRDELINQHGDPLYSQLYERKAIAEWCHPHEFVATTLTPWSASLLGVRLAEYWVRWVEQAQEYRGVGRRPAKIRVQRWDTESYWIYRGKPERSVRIPANTCELPLIGDPEDKSYCRDKGEYLEDWQTWSFTKNPRKALTLTIRVGSFAHKIVIQRDAIKAKKRHSKRKQRRQRRQPA